MKKSDRLLLSFFVVIVLVFLGMFLTVKTKFNHHNFTGVEASLGPRTTRIYGGYKDAKPIKFTGKTEKRTPSALYYSEISKAYVLLIKSDSLVRKETQDTLFLMAYAKKEVRENKTGVVDTVNGHPVISGQIDMETYNFVYLSDISDLETTNTDIYFSMISKHLPPKIDWKMERAGLDMGFDTYQMEKHLMEEQGEKLSLRIPHFKDFSIQGKSAFLHFGPIQFDSLSLKTDYGSIWLTDHFSAKHVRGKITNTVFGFHESKEVLEPILGEGNIFQKH